jgi:predicted LPLAT superfamily acyltransferase
VLGVTLSSASTLAVLCLTAITGVGLGMVMPAMQVAVQHAAGRELLGAAIGSMSLCRSIGGAIGVAVIGAVIFTSIGRSGSGLSAIIQHVMDAGPEYLGQLSAEDRLAIASQLDQTFRIVFLSIAAVTGVGALIATTVPKPKF